MGLQFGHSVTQLVWAAKQADDVAHLAMGGQRRHLQHVRQDELGIPVHGIFFEEVVENLTSLWAISAEEVRVGLP